MSGFRKYLPYTLGIPVGLCLLLTAVLAIGNLRLPQHSAVIETLSESDKIRLAEFLHLRQEVGEAVWPGWSTADIPAISYNEEYAFLIGYPDPPDGWVKVPQGIQRGGAWERVPGDIFDGQAYYRQPLPSPEDTPEAFTVMVGDRWVSSMPTLDWFRIGLANQIREDLPAFVRPVFPYTIFTKQLVRGSEQYISLSAHEAFHSFQGLMAPHKFAGAELISRFEKEYPWDDPALQVEWQTELDVLMSALRAGDRAQRVDLVRKFLAVRTSRRASVGLSPELISYEENREWLEGLARYAELEIWRQALTDGYMPIPEIAYLDDFRDYTGFDRRWSQEVDQLSRMAGDDGDGRFYYTGMAQAVLLDRLLPGWKAHAFDEKKWLEALLEEAIQDQH